METPFAKAKRSAMKAEFDSEALTTLLMKLLKEGNESLREAALRSGMDHQALRRLLAGQRPNITTCILLADHFGISPNDLLKLAGWPTMKVFDVAISSDENLPAEAIEVARDIAKIKDPITRKAVTEAIRTLLAKYLE